MAFEASGCEYRHSGNGRFALEGQNLLTIGAAYSPCSGQSSEERQAFYDHNATNTRGECSLETATSQHRSASEPSLPTGLRRHGGIKGEILGFGTPSGDTGGKSMRIEFSSPDLCA